ncbi:hypothetical protein [Haloarchaeobius sp. DFWS5]|uniref:hypothetical protein n=1 Tax=Haloarchaeobius sp. DFWS5 TaxID=3446114 RepID=UPI003EB87441
MGSSHPGWDPESESIQFADLFASIEKGLVIAVPFGSRPLTAYARSMGRDRYDVLLVNEHSALCWRETWPRQKTKRYLQKKIEKADTFRLEDYRDLWPSRYQYRRGDSA